MTNSEWIEKLRAAAAMCQSRDDALDHKYWAAVAFDMLPKASGRITELEAQVAALREIAIEERAKYEALSGWYVDGWEELDEEDDSALVEKNIHGKRFFRDEARRQLAEEHPEAFR